MPPRFEWNIADLWLPAAIDRSDDPRTPRGNRAFQAHLRPGVSPKEAEAQLNVIGARRAQAYPNDYPPQSPLPGHHGHRLGRPGLPRRALHAVRRGQPAAGDRLLQRRQHAAGASDQPRARDRRSAPPSAPAAAASSGSCSSRARCWPSADWSRAALLAYGGHPGARPPVAAGSGCAVGDADQAGSTGARVRDHRRRRSRRSRSGCSRRCRACGAISPPVRNVAGRTTAGRRQTRMRSSLVIAQVALSIVLLLGAGLLMRTFVKLVGVDLGFNPAHVLVAFLAFPPQQNTAGRTISVGSTVRSWTDRRACPASRPLRSRVASLLLAGWRAGSRVPAPLRTHRRGRWCCSAASGCRRRSAFRS